MMKKRRRNGMERHILASRLRPIIPQALERLLFGLPLARYATLKNPAMALLWNVVFALVGVVALLYYYVTRHFNYWTSRGVAGPKPTPFFGNFKGVLLQWISPAKFLQDMYNEYAGAPYVGFFVLDKPFLLLRDPDVIKHILMKDFNYFADHYADSCLISDPLFTRGMFLSKGNRWKQLRTALNPVFTPGRMKKMFYLMLECGTQLKTQLTKQIMISSVPEPIEVKELMAKTGIDVITTCAFGINSNCISNPNAEFGEFGRSIFVYSFRRSLESTALWFMPWLVKLARMSFYPTETAEFLHNVFWDTIKVREKRGVPRHDVIDQLIQLKNRGHIEEETSPEGKSQEQKSSDLGIFNFNGEDLLAQAALFFAAGYDRSSSTSSTLSFTLYELALQPDIQSRLRTEINNVIARHDGQVTYDAVLEMKYLDAVLSETLRKYPTLPFLDRICLKDYVEPGTGLKIEKGLRFGLIAAKTELASVLSCLEVLPCPDTPIPLVLNPKATVLTPVGGIPLLFKLIE